MILYYSATGNTRYAALFLAKEIDARAIDILTLTAEEISYLCSRINNCERVGFVFPIYCWGIPPVMHKMIEALASGIPRESYVWALSTCGDETGIAMKILNNKLEKRRGRGADALFSLFMPNTYVLLPGFDVDKPEVEKSKLEKAPERLKEIARLLNSHKTDIYDVHEGSMPAIRTRLIFPLFEKWGVFPKKWHVSEACISCGKCEGICPAKNVKLEEGHPVWGENCWSCCGCFHICPVKAISYGNITKNKSQYICPLKAGD